LTSHAALPYDPNVSFWDDLSSNVKRYLIVAVVLLGVLLALRTCAKPGGSGGPPPRGVMR
jgi:hypothetical protein